MSILFDTIVIRRVSNPHTLSCNELQLWIDGVNILPNITNGTSINEDGKTLGETTEFFHNTTKITQRAYATNRIASNIATNSFHDWIAVSSLDENPKESSEASLYIPLTTSINYNNIQSFVFYGSNKNNKQWARDRSLGLRIELYNRDIDPNITTPLVYTETINDATGFTHRFDFPDIDSYPTASFGTGFSPSNIPSDPTKVYTYTDNIGNWFTAFPEYSAPPSPPTNISAHPLSSTSVDISFTESAGATEYTATSGDISGTSTESPITINDLSAGQLYTFEVFATNFAGDSSHSEVSITLPMPLINFDNDVFITKEPLFTNSFTNSEDIVIHNSGSGSIKFLTNQTEQMKIDASGVVTIQNLTVSNKIYFNAYGPAGGSTINTTDIVPYSVVTANIGGGYNNSNYTFTAPIEGTYLFYFSYYSDNRNDCRADFIDKNNNILIRLAREISVNKNIGDPIVFHTSMIYKLSKNDTIRVHGAVTPFSIQSDSVFGGYLLGP